MSQDPDAMNLDDNYGKLIPSGYLHGDYNHADSPGLDHAVPGQATYNEIDPLGKDVKEAAAILSRLEGLGLQQYDISLPRCIVLGMFTYTGSKHDTDDEFLKGQQSTGKSSVIEAISGIKTPRDTDTCTCCPLYITMRPSDSMNEVWRAQVSLQLEFVPDQHPQPAKEPLFRGWTPALASTRQVPFKETKSREDLENIIRAAQMAILNPLEDPHSFLANPRPRHRGQQNKFSPNTVRIDITEPGLPPLSFYDLPGLISQAETEDERYTVPLVKNLVGEYVKKRDTLILVTCDLGTDIANSTAAAFARDCDATDRCIGKLPHYFILGVISLTTFRCSDQTGPSSLGYH